MNKRLLSIPCACALLSACASGPALVGRPDLTIVEGGSLPPPTTIDLIGEERPYVIGPLDRVSVEVFGIPELSKTVQVDGSGRVAFPLIGSIDASGKTPAQLGVEITQALSGRYVRNPRVTVNLTEAVSQVVTVDGSVQKPGLYPVAGKLTLMRAIAIASGTSEFADDNHVVVFRRVNNKNMAALYDLRAIRQGMYADPDIYANDVVLVGDSQARRLFRDLVQLSPLLAAPLVTILN